MPNVPDSVVRDVLRLSWKFDLKQQKQCYRDLLSLKKFSETLTLSEMERVFKGHNWSFQDIGFKKKDKKNNMFIFDHQNPKFIIHFKVEDSDKSV